MKKLEIKKVTERFEKGRKDITSTLAECTSVQDIKGRWYLRQYITPATSRKDLTQGEITAEILKTFERRKAKEIKKELELIERIFNAGEISEVKISIEWKKSQMWGSNPCADIQIYGDAYENFYSGSIGGCGYDKESMAFANAINQSLAFRKLLLSNRDKIENDYGHSNGLLSGGVGTSCYYSIFEHLGYKLTKVASGKMYDAYHITKN